MENFSLMSTNTLGKNYIAYLSKYQCNSRPRYFPPRLPKNARQCTIVSSRKPTSHGAYIADPDLQQTHRVSLNTALKLNSK